MSFPPGTIPPNDPIFWLITLLMDLVMFLSNTFLPLFESLTRGW